MVLLMDKYLTSCPSASATAIKIRNRIKVALTLGSGDLHVGIAPRDSMLDVDDIGGVRSLDIAPIGTSKLIIGVLARGLSG